MKMIILFLILSLSWSFNSYGQMDNDILYYIMVDRFDDGDTGNNIPNYAFMDQEQDLFDINSGEKNQEWVNNYNQASLNILPTLYDPSRRFLGLYWGGDLAGIKNRLGYLKELGVTKIVLTPIMDNTNGYLENNNSDYLLRVEVKKTPEKFLNHPAKNRMTAYHGYWTRDLYEIDEHFRSSNIQIKDRYYSMKILLTEAKKMGIGIILDISMNQTSPMLYDTKAQKLYRTDQYNSYNGIFIDDGALFKHGKLKARGLDHITQKENPDHWFHPFFDSRLELNPPLEIVEVARMSGGVADLNQDNPAVSKYLLEALKFWLLLNKENDATIVGFRLDAIKHVNYSFWKKVEKTVHEINPKALLYGEYFDGGLSHRASLDFLTKTQNITMMDFDMANSVRRFFAKERNWAGRVPVIVDNARNGENQDVVRRLLAPINPIPLNISSYARSLVRSKKINPSDWITFLESHDYPRLKTQYPQMSDTAYISAVRFLLAGRGIPLLMYGTETALAVPYHPKHEGLFGVGGDPFNRPMMIFKDHPGFKLNIFNATKEMINLRKDFPFLHNGSTEFIYPNGASEGDIFMVRKDVKKRQLALYAYSTTGGQFIVDQDLPSPMQILKKTSSSKITSSIVVLEAEESAFAIFSY